MIDFKSLDPDTRTYALVGRFLQYWALMEHEINKAIAQVLDLTSLQRAITCSNMNLRDKIHVLKTSVSLSPIAEKQQFTKLLTDIAEYSSIRNMMAHDMFMASEDGESVVFYVIKAKGKLTFPDVTWTITDFDQSCMTMRSYTDALQRLSSMLRDASISSILGKGLLASSPNARNYAQELGSLPVPPPPAGLTWDMIRSNPEADDETPPSPQG